MIDAWLPWIATTSIPLFAIDQDGAPVSIASGAILTYRERRFLVTVSHAIEMGDRRWAIRIGQTSNGKTEVYHLPELNYLGEVRQGDEFVTMRDFAFTELPAHVLPLFQHCDPHGHVQLEQPCHIFATDLTQGPNEEQLYGFSGRVHPEAHPDNVLLTECQVYPGLRYSRTENGIHYFTLPVPHPGHRRFQGCSGAPIVDRDSNVIGLVSAGDLETNEIYGLSTQRFRVALDFYVNALRSNTGFNSVAGKAR